MASRACWERPLASAMKEKQGRAVLSTEGAACPMRRRAASVAVTIGAESSAVLAVGLSATSAAADAFASLKARAWAGFGPAVSSADVTEFSATIGVAQVPVGAMKSVTAGMGSELSAVVPAFA